MSKSEKYHEEILQIIKKNKHIYFIESIFIFYHAIAKRQFYKLNLHEKQDIKEAIFKNREGVKFALRLKMLNSENASNLIALYKLVANQDERERLSNTARIELAANKPKEVTDADRDEIIKKLKGG